MNDKHKIAMRWVDKLRDLDNYLRTNYDILTEEQQREIREIVANEIVIHNMKFTKPNRAIFKP